MRFEQPDRVKAKNRSGWKLQIIKCFEYVKEMSCKNPSLSINQKVNKHCYREIMREMFFGFR